MQSWYTIRALAGAAEVSIYDEIGAHGVSAKGFLAELGALADGTPIDLRLNSPGGSVFDAVAIHNALQRHPGEITVWIDGIAASAASYVAMAGDAIVMPENAFLMLHDPAGMVIGTAVDMRAMADALDKVKGSLVQGYAAKSGRPDAEIATLMADETWFDAQDALASGLADRIAEPVRLVARFDIAQFRNAPPELVEAVQVPETVPDGNGIQGDAQGPAGPDEDVANGNEPGADDPAVGTPPPDPAAVRQDAIAHARAVVDLCRLAGQPQLAGRFLEQDADLGQVRAALLAARAEAEPQIDPQHPQPGPPTNTRPWGDVIARTFRQKD